MLNRAMLPFHKYPPIQVSSCLLLISIITAWAIAISTKTFCSRGFIWELLIQIVTNDCPQRCPQIQWCIHPYIKKITKFLPCSRSRISVSELNRQGPLLIFLSSWKDRQQSDEYVILSCSKQHKECNEGTRRQTRVGRGKYLIRWSGKMVKRKWRGDDT